jgi:hypothetical protein
METYFLLVVLVIVIAGYRFGIRRARNEIAARFADRDQLDREQICDLFLDDTLKDRELIWELVEHVASELSVRPELLRPEDSFGSELRSPRGWEFDSGQAILFRELSVAARRKHISLNPPEIVTLRDYVIAAAKVYQ